MAANASRHECAPAGRFVAGEGLCRTAFGMEREDTKQPLKTPFSGLFWDWAKDYNLHSNNGIAPNWSPLGQIAEPGVPKGIQGEYRYPSEIAQQKIRS